MPYELNSFMLPIHPHHSFLYFCRHNCRYLPQVRTAALDALVLLLDKGGRLLKAFVPQLQTSLVKNLTDASEPARAALRALKRLLRLSTRVDPLVRLYSYVN